MRFAVLAIAAAAVDAVPAPQVSRLAIVAVVIVGVDALPRPHYDSIDAIVGAENVGELNGVCASSPDTQRVAARCALFNELVLTSFARSHACARPQESVRIAALGTRGRLRARTRVAPTALPASPLPRRHHRLLCRRRHQRFHRSMSLPSLHQPRVVRSHKHHPLLVMRTSSSSAGTSLISPAKSRGDSSAPSI